SVTRTSKRELGGRRRSISCHSSNSAMHSCSSSHKGPSGDFRGDGPADGPKKLSYYKCVFVVQYRQRCPGIGCILCNRGNVESVRYTFQECMMGSNPTLTANLPQNQQHTQHQQFSSGENRATREPSLPLEPLHSLFRLPYGGISG